ncbi:MAG: biotin--[acetyl-CoA-carboxylase] ligase [Sedimentisphaerales bacterium]|nr:biotin--[acetyl-CoA-carboxylase] ligase [Sedimentisphaerales bacterium]
MPCSKNDPLDPDRIKASPGASLIGRQVIVFSSTSSTNDIAAEYARDKSNNGLVVFAEEQTAGRGRAASKWLSDPGQSILCSVLLTDCPLNPELLSLTAAVAVAETIGRHAKVKWPNDIFLNGKKAAGILLESKNHGYGTAYIIGIGINCHQQKHSVPADLQNTATSIDIETKTTCNRISLAKRLLACLDHRIETAQTDETRIIELWRKRSIQLGHRITLIYNADRFTGNCIGIDPQKGLILQLDAGAVRFFDAAHTTIAK